VKLYVSEAGHEEVRGLSDLIVAVLARVEVPAALWRKARSNGASTEDAALTVSAFERDWYSDARYTIVSLEPGVLDHAAHLVAVHRLRGADAIQLASALAARRADPGCTAFACFDQRLRDAGAIEGFTLVP
jgi:predicted nucleic acid-binding protein